MRIERMPTPRGFVANVFRPGRAWLEAHPYPEQVKALWRDVRLADGRTCQDALAESYHHICAYSLFRGRVSLDVEHYKPKQDPLYRKLAYCWFNYRLADSRLNIWKHRAQLPDPFKVGINACTLNFEKDALIELDKSQNGWQALEKAIATLRLNTGALKKDRYEAYTRYLSEDEQEHIGIVPLSEDYPFVAYEMLRQGRIKDQDRDKCKEVLHELGFAWV